MTEDFKEKLLKYLTGNIDEEEPGDTLVYENANIITTDLATTLDTEFTNGYAVRGIIESKNINGNTLNYNVLYGAYTKTENLDRGFVAILDDKGNLIQLIKEYSSSAEIGNINTMNVDEEGYFYMIEINPANDKHRFVMLNNVVLKTPIQEEYEVKIRRAYNIPDTSKINDVLIRGMTKAIGQAKYLLAAFIVPESGLGVTLCVTELTINVGAENEWVDYVGTQWTDPDTGRLSIFSNLYLYGEWTNDNVDFIVLMHPTGYPQYIVKYYKDGDSLPYTNISTPIRDIESGSRWSIQYTIVNMNIAYLSEGMHDLAWGSNEKHRIYTIDLDNETITMLYEQQGYYDENDQILAYCSFQHEIIDGELVFTNTYCDNNNVCHIEIGRLRDDAFIPSGTYGNISTHEIAQINADTPVSNIAKFYVNKQFNLYNYNLLLGNLNYNGIEVYNSNNYNGTPYENINSLVSNSGILYNGTTAIFARNLYDRNIIGNMTTSTIQVPNAFLNDIEIDKQNLMSETNGIMVQNTDTITKNIYEELLINFMNTITISNHNDPNNIIYNYNGAARLNNSVSNPAVIDYSNCQGTKYRITYTDETTKEETLVWTPTGNYYTTEIQVFNPADNEITNLEIISSDGNTIYQTIDTSSFNKNKKYIINQDVYIDEKEEE